MINFEQELNSEQLQAVQHGDGPCLVLAGAGSGKTRTITYRVAYLLEQGVPAENILLVTFTNKAAAEMKRRVGEIMGAKPGVNILPWSGTFHHIAYRILRVYAPLLGFKNNFTILDSDDSEAILKNSIKAFKTGEDTKKFPSPGVVKALISYARNADISMAEAVERKFEHLYQYVEVLQNIANDYIDRKKTSNAMDFDDLLVNLLLLLNNDQVGQKFAQQFKYILVDEYQDTNKIQALIIKKLATVHQNILVVGDDAQSIYSFRAADIANILQFERDYPNAKIFKLETNYRSGKEILDLANNVISNNVRQYQKKLKTISELGYKPRLHPQMDQRSEAEFVAYEINKLIDSGVAHKDIAVLFRAAHHSQQLEMELMKSGIMYDYRGGLRFFDRAHVKDVLAYLRLISNLNDVSAWLRVLLHEEGIGPVAAQKLVDAIKNLENIEALKSLGEQVLGAKAQQGWNNFLAVYDPLTAAGKEPGKMIEAILSSRYRDYLDTEFVDSRERVDDIKQMVVFAQNYTDLEQFLAEAVLQEGFQGKEITATAGSTDKIILSTIHQAKGLEWHSVFVINLASGAFPNDRALREDGGAEEERRLFYVAITRAKKNLVLTYPMAGGGWGDSVPGPSLFISEIDNDLLDDSSLLSTDVTIFNDPENDIVYVPEDKPLKIRPGSFLRSIDDL